MKGIDLITEGVITLSKARDILDNDIQNNVNHALITYKTADNPARELINSFYKADSINFLLGTAVNEIYKNYDFPLESKLKMKLVIDIAEKLTKLGKDVEIEYF